MIAASMLILTSASVFGIFNIYPANLAHAVGHHEFHTIAAQISHDLKHLYAIIQDERDHVHRLVCLDTHVLSQKMTQLSEVSCRWSSINQVLFYVKESLRAIKSELAEWKKFRTNFSRSVDDSIGDVSSGEAKQQLFLSLLVLGSSSEQLEAFLAKELGQRVRDAC